MAFARLMVVLTLGLTLMGCGDRHLSLPSPVTASGKITLANGQPVKHVRLMFTPIEAMAPASGVVKDDGTFTLNTYDSKPGACAGKYRVIIQLDQSSPEGRTKSAASLKSVPEKYQQENSPLEVTIGSLGNSSIELKLDAR
jgi:hypothetical protein